MKKHEYNFVIDELSAQLYRYAFHFLRNQEDAKDIIQDVFEKMWLNRKTIELETVKPWLYRCTHNAMVNFIAKKSRTSYMSNQELPKTTSPFDSSFESMQVVDRMVSILPPTQKSIILLRDIEGYTYKEIGLILDLSASQVKVYLFRARMKIKKQLIGLNKPV
ncbi:MAG: RNA polymerase sigma factor [Crocinitomicaceae bacterium]|nr:RNA polymerase sigma factor [Crocinitomicaceae bacterium]